MRTPRLLLILLLCACGRAEREREAAVEAARAATMAEIEGVLSKNIRLADRIAGSADRILEPLPVMTPAEEEALRRFRNAAHVARARELGVRATDDEARLASGRRAPRPARGQHPSLDRPGGQSPPRMSYPTLRTLLDVLAERFQERLTDMGLPPYRLEVTSALRTAERQEELRQSNANAAAGVSSHEFGTTVDLSYAAFAPPADRPPEMLAGDVPAELAPASGADRGPGTRVGLGPQVTGVGRDLQPGAPGGAGRGTGAGDLRTAADGLSPHGRARAGAPVARHSTSHRVERLRALGALFREPVTSAR